MLEVLAVILDVLFDVIPDNPLTAFTTIVVVTLSRGRLYDIGTYTDTIIIEVAIWVPKVLTFPR